jgi:hypothetical protein
MIGDFEDNLIKLILLRNKPMYKDSINEINEPIAFLKQVGNIFVRALEHTSVEDLSETYGVSATFIGKMLNK